MKRIRQKGIPAVRDWRLCIRYVMAAVLLGTGIVGSIILPSKILDWGDAQRIEKSQIWQVTEVELTARVNMSITEKINLLMSSQSSTIGMQNGRYYTQDTIWQQVKEELLELRRLKILEDEDLEHFVLDSKEVFFAMNRQDSEQSMMFWSGSGHTDRSYIEWVLDDETGKLLAVGQWDKVYVSVDMGSEKEEQKKKGTEENATVEIPSVSTETNLADISEKWAGYLGCKIVDVPDEEEVNLYNAQVLDDEAGTYTILKDERGTAALRVQKDMSAGVFSLHLGF